MKSSPSEPADSVLSTVESWPNSDDEEDEIDAILAEEHDYDPFRLAPTTLSGVKRIFVSWQKYDSVAAPLCHDCPTRLTDPSVTDTARNSHKKRAETPRSSVRLLQPFAMSPSTTLSATSSGTTKDPRSPNWERYSLPCAHGA